MRRVAAGCEGAHEDFAIGEVELQDTVLRLAPLVRLDHPELQPPPPQPPAHVRWALARRWERGGRTLAVCSPSNVDAMLRRAGGWAAAPPPNPRGAPDHRRQRQALTLGPTSYDCSG